MKRAGVASALRVAGTVRTAGVGQVGRAQRRRCATVASHGARDVNKTQISKLSTASTLVEERRDLAYYAPPSLYAMSPAAEAFAAGCERAGLAAKVAFIGGGNMARALADGFVAAGLLEPNRIGISEPDANARNVCQASGYQTTDSTVELLRAGFADGIVIVAVKPHVLQAVGAQCGGELRRCRLVVSILAGVKIATVAKELGLLMGSEHGGEHYVVPVVRVMPNTPALVGCGASVFATGPQCDEAHADIMRSLLETVGTCDRVPESLVDAACGLSGSGPAFVYTVIDAMADGGVKMGLSRELATKLAAQTVLGSGRMVLETGKHPCELKAAVCSPAGTTIAGVHAMEAGGARAALISAVEAAVKRAAELGAQ